jgi:hypothetical protein
MNIFSAGRGSAWNQQTPSLQPNFFRLTVAILATTCRSVRIPVATHVRLLSSQPEWIGESKATNEDGESLYDGFSVKGEHFIAGKSVRFQFMSPEDDEKNVDCLAEIRSVFSASSEGFVNIRLYFSPENIPIMFTRSPYGDVSCFMVHH